MACCNRGREPCTDRGYETKRQVGQAWVWAVLGAFLLFSICLPLGHVCLNHPLGATSRITYTEARSAADPVTHGQPAWQAARLDEIHEDDVCQACLIAQNLFLDDRAVELTIIDSTNSTLDRLYAPVIAVADSSRSAFKRAPPASL